MLTLLVASVPAWVSDGGDAWAQSSAQATATAATNSAEIATLAAEQHLAHLAQLRGGLQRRYEAETAEIDRLKRQRASWRRDRELRDSLSSSLETSNQLEAVTRELDKAHRELSHTRRTYLAAVELELGGEPTGRRASHLDRIRAVLEAQVKAAPRRIVIPDLEIDLLADPEELVLRATELRAIEDELGRQLAALASRVADLDHAAQLRRQHSRAADLVNRDDDQSHRTARSRGGATAEGADQPLIDPTHLPTSPLSPTTFDNAVPTVLADVIDASTISSFTAAQRSGDPAKRAQAARRAHDAVAKRLDQVRKKRAEIEARAGLLTKRR